MLGNNLKQIYVILSIVNNVSLVLSFSLLHCHLELLGLF
jgi:hypothetical protein